MSLNAIPVIWSTLPNSYKVFSIHKGWVKIKLASLTNLKWILEPSSLIWLLNNFKTNERVLGIVLQSSRVNSLGNYKSKRLNK